jgi:hypothetical protein
MGKFKVGDIIVDIAYINAPKYHYKVYHKDNIKNRYGLIIDQIFITNSVHKIGDTFDHSYTLIDKICQLVTLPTTQPITISSNNKFNIGDILQLKTLVFYHHQIDTIDHGNQRYYFTKIWAKPGAKDPVGTKWDMDFKTVHIEYELVPRTTTGQLITPVPKTDQYIGKMYKVMASVGTVNTQYRTNEILIVKEKGILFANSYLLTRMNDPKDKGIILNINEFNTYLIPYIQPICNCGIEKTYEAFHHMKAPVRLHYLWCEVSKGEKI